MKWGEKTHMDRKYKMMNDIVLDDGSLRSDGIYHATEEKLRIFQTTNDVYDMAALKPLGVQLLMLPYRKRK